PRPLAGSFLNATAIRERRLIHVPDLQSSTEFPEGAEVARRLGYRAMAVAPMVRGDRAVGSVTLRRIDARPFSGRQLELLQAFAAQAAIAVENVRLINETKDSLERQTATSDVLKAMSRSAFELDPVLNTVIETAVRLTHADWGNVLRAGDDGLRLAAASGKAEPRYIAFMRENAIPLTRGSASGRAAVERRTVHIEDVLVESDYEQKHGQELAGFRTVLAVPMIR